jgi:hypothetical protein
MQLRATFARPEATVSAESSFLRFSHIVKFTCLSALFVFFTHQVLHQFNHSPLVTQYERVQMHPPVGYSLCVPIYELLHRCHVGPEHLCRLFPDRLQCVYQIHRILQRLVLSFHIHLFEDCTFFDEIGAQAPNQLQKLHYLWYDQMCILYARSSFPVNESTVQIFLSKRVSKHYRTQLYVHPINYLPNPRLQHLWQGPTQDTIQLQIEHYSHGAPNVLEVNIGPLDRILDQHEQMTCLLHLYNRNQHQMLQRSFDQVRRWPDWSHFKLDLPTNVLQRPTLDERIRWSMYVQHVIIPFPRISAFFTSCILTSEEVDRHPKITPFGLYSLDVGRDLHQNLQSLEQFLRLHSNETDLFCAGHKLDELIAFHERVEQMPEACSIFKVPVAPTFEYYRRVGLSHRKVSAGNRRIELQISHSQWRQLQFEQPNSLLSSVLLASNVLGILFGFNLMHCRHLINRVALSFIDVLLPSARAPAARFRYIALHLYPFMIMTVALWQVGVLCEQFSSHSSMLRTRTELKQPLERFTVTACLPFNILNNNTHIDFLTRSKPTPFEELQQISLQREQVLLNARLGSLDLLRSNGTWTLSHSMFIRRQSRCIALHLNLGHLRHRVHRHLWLEFQSVVSELYVRPYTELPSYLDFQPYYGQTQFRQLQFLLLSSPFENNCRNYSSIRSTIEFGLPGNPYFREHRLRLLADKKMPRLSLQFRFSNPDISSSNQIQNRTSVVCLSQNDCIELCILASLSDRTKYYVPWATALNIDRLPFIFAEEGELLDERLQELWWSVLGSCQQQFPQPNCFEQFYLPIDSQELQLYDHRFVAIDLMSDLLLVERIPSVQPLELLLQVLGVLSFFLGCSPLVCFHLLLFLLVCLLIHFRRFAFEALMRTRESWNKFCNCPSTRSQLHGRQPNLVALTDTFKVSSNDRTRLSSKHVHMLKANENSSATSLKAQKYVLLAILFGCTLLQLLDVACMFFYQNQFTNFLIRPVQHLRPPLISVCFELDSTKPADFNPPKASKWTQPNYEALATKMLRNAHAPDRQFQSEKRALHDNMTVLMVKSYSFSLPSVISAIQYVDHNNEVKTMNETSELRELQRVGRLGSLSVFEFLFQLMRCIAFRLQYPEKRVDVQRLRGNVLLQLQIKFKHFYVFVGNDFLSRTPTVSEKRAQSLQIRYEHLYRAHPSSISSDKLCLASNRELWQLLRSRSAPVPPRTTARYPLSMKPHSPSVSDNDMLLHDLNVPQNLFSRLFYSSDLPTACVSHYTSTIDEIPHFPFSQNDGEVNLRRKLSAFQQQLVNKIRFHNDSSVNVTTRSDRPRLRRKLITSKTKPTHRNPMPPAYKHMIYFRNGKVYVRKKLNRSNKPDLPRVPFKQFAMNRPDYLFRVHKNQINWKGKLMKLNKIYSREPARASQVKEKAFDHTMNVRTIKLMPALIEQFSYIEYKISWHVLVVYLGTILSFWLDFSFLDVLSYAERSFVNRIARRRLRRRRANLRNVRLQSA